MKPFLKKCLLGAVSCAALSACSSMKTPENLEPVALGDGYQAQYRALASTAAPISGR